MILEKYCYFIKMLGNIYTQTFIANSASFSVRITDEKSGLLWRSKNILMRLLVFDILHFISRSSGKIAEGKVMIPAVYEPSASDIGDFPISTHSAIFWLKYLVKV